MCGIAGVFHYQSKGLVDEQELVAVRDVMENRGPDDKGLRVDRSKKVGLAHRRLSIIDTGPAGHQPLSEQSGRYTIVFNGEIYNYQLLRGALEEKSYQFLTHTDTEVLLHLYAEYGSDMLRYLRGMFAFAIWDDQEKKLFLARDAFGIKPLYYGQSEGRFYFASQVKALLKNTAFKKELNPAAKIGFFLWGSVPEPHTIYAGIQALEAGCYLTVSESGVEETSYYSVSNKIKQIEKICQPSEKSLKAMLLDTVRHHFIADVPVGIFLSSGIDSSCLLALAREAGVKHVKTITLGFEEYRNTDYDEVPLAEMLAKHYQTDHQTIWLSKKDFHEELKNLLHVMDQPSIDGVNTYFVSLAAKRAGLKVALSGLGADEIFAGYNTFKRIPAIVKYCQGSALLPGVGKLLRVLTSPFLGKKAGLLEYGKNYEGAYLLNRALYMPWELKKILARNSIKDSVKKIKSLSCLNQPIKGVRYAKNKVSCLELSHYMRNQLLRDADWAGMAHSVEIRVPYLDLPLFEYCLNRFPRKISKTLLFTALSKPLPDEITSRKKTGFFVPVREWLLDGKDCKSAPDLKAWARYVFESFG